jgi:hypothetical protein
MREEIKTIGENIDKFEEFSDNGKLIGVRCGSIYIFRDDSLTLMHDVSNIKLDQYELVYLIRIVDDKISQIYKDNYHQKYVIERYNTFSEHIKKIF